jgi:asparagine synthase (glutamine-hydrolysing)
MCGICGIAGLESTEESGRVVRRMTAALFHRGPDEEGILVSPSAAPSVSLGMRRLSIIDLPGGHQPVFNETNDVAVVYNGEIYNFRDLRTELERAGHSFRTHSDTEVIVHAFEQWGEACVGHLRGMFAFAVLDMRRTGGTAPRLFLARDRLGIKPLYYTFHGNKLIFASEVRALLASGHVPRRLSTSALDSYLLFGSVCEPATLIEDVFSIPPGHCMSVSAAAPQRACAPAPYWTFGRAASRGFPKREKKITLNSAASNLLPLLEDAISRHLIADVPLGVFLSSGLDSTAIVALASRAQKDLRTFTVVFPEQEFSEAKLARATAKHFGTHHEELMLSGEEMLAHLDDAVAALDQPTMDGINTYFVSWAAHRAGLKVALSGTGGDEVFGGYSTFRSAPRAARLASIGRRLPRALRSATAQAVGRAGGGRGDAARKIASLWTNADDLPHPYFFTRSLFTPSHVAALRGNSKISVQQSPWWAWLAESARQAATLDSFAAVSCLESRSYLVNTLLRDTDSVSMAHSLEVRVPLLDHVLVEFVAQIPAAAKSRRGENKALLVEALRAILPKEIIHQRKRTFTFPWEHWFRGALGPRIRAGLAELTPALAGHLDAATVRAVWLAFEAARTNWSRPWSLYVLNEWCRRNLDVRSADDVQAAAGVSDLAAHSQASA